MWILLEARHLNSFNNFSSEPDHYVFSYIMDGRIISFLVSQCFEYTIQCIPLHSIF